MFKTDNSIPLFLIRLSLGAVMFAHGAQKALGWYGGPGIEKTIQIFTSKMNFPVWLILLLVVIEFFGSLGLIVGFLTRLAALGIGTSLAVCAYLNHFQNGFFMNWFGTQKGEGFEFHILAVGIALALVIKGGGFLSIDRVISKGK
jgi:putative oxidoreductase